MDHDRWILSGPGGPDDELNDDGLTEAELEALEQEAKEEAALARLDRMD